LRWLRHVVLGMQEQHPVLIVPILNNGEGCARCSDEGNTSNEPMQGLGCGSRITFAEMRHREYRGTLSSSHFTDRFQHSANLGVLVAVGLAHVRADRIYVDQGHVADLVELLFQQVEIGLQVENSLTLAI